MRLSAFDNLCDDYQRPAVALPNGRTEVHGPTRLPVYEIHALGGTTRETIDGAPA